MMPAHVTQHAVRRYAERVMNVAVDEDMSDDAAVFDLTDRGFDVDGIRQRLHDVCDDAADLGAVAVKADNARMIMRGPVVVTVLEKSRSPYFMRSRQ